MHCGEERWKGKVSGEEGELVWGEVEEISVP